eukprot:TRINITY_DN10689_c0_g1_i1.p1 TRINITY_DN10689_c0_g1~~TRINITY_DN10689_c0_g1_i1.p1  ORF type:complete len:580 (+),score=194.40 TRINITY_DN10689_c0_g1_i1:66-1805(+)
MVDVGDPYGTLGLLPGASISEVTTAYRKASLRVHPDRCPGDPSAAEKFARLTRARDLLLENARRFAPVSSLPEPTGGVPGGAPLAAPRWEPRRWVDGKATVRASAAAQAAASQQAAGGARASKPTKRSNAAAKAKAAGKVVTKAKAQAKTAGKAKAKPKSTATVKAKAQVQTVSKRHRQGSAASQAKTVKRRVGGSVEKPEVAEEREEAIEEEERDGQEEEEEEEEADEDAEDSTPDGVFALLHQTLSRTDCDVPEVPLSARLLLAGMCLSMGSHYQGPPPHANQLHRFERATLDMVGEALVSIRAARSEEVAKTSKRAEQAAEDVAKTEALAADVQSAKDAAASAKAEVSQRSVLLTERKDELQRARDAEQEAATEVSSKEQEEAACAAMREAVQQALAVFIELESSGPPEKKLEAKRMVKQVEKQMKAVRVSDTLFASSARAVLPALEMKPEKRSRFAAAALSGAEGCFRDFIKEHGEQLIRCRREVAMARAALERARVTVQAACIHVEAEEERLRRAKEQLCQANSAMRAAEAAHKSHNQELASLARCANVAQAALARHERTEREFRLIPGLAASE